jgi:outer membrane protein OmpA-like peptidoglycan-associated protein
VGQKGDTGYTQSGVAGEAGRTGVAGPQGPAGPTGAQGGAGVVDRWVSYRDFWFDFDKSDMQASETAKVADIASYLKKNPSLQVGIDGSMDARGTDPRNQELSDRRVNAIRESLIKAGVPAEKIKSGAFGDERLRRDRRVEVLISTAN